MELKDVEGWQKARAANTDPYGNCVMEFAEQWADLMEQKMAEGAPLETIAPTTFQEVNHRAGMDITGFMYGATVSTLAAVWVHGEALRRWHNLDIQLGHEGERANEKGTTLNPALLNLG